MLQPPLLHFDTHLFFKNHESFISLRHDEIVGFASASRVGRDEETIPLEESGFFDSGEDGVEPVETAWEVEVAPEAMAENESDFLFAVTEDAFL